MDDDLFSFVVGILYRVSVTLCLLFWWGVLLFVGLALS